MDSNHRRTKPARLQRAPFDHSGTDRLVWTVRFELDDLSLPKRALYQAELHPDTPRLRVADMDSSAAGGTSEVTLRSLRLMVTRIRICRNRRQGIAIVLLLLAQLGGIEAWRKDLDDVPALTVGRLELDGGTDLGTTLLDPTDGFRLGAPKAALVI